MESEPSGQATYLPTVFFLILQMCFSFYCRVLQLKSHKDFLVKIYIKS